MQTVIAANEATLRLGFFFAIFAVMALWETLAPRRRRSLTRRVRWPGNIGIVVLNTLLLRVIFPAGAVGLAVAIEGRGWGLLGGTGLPVWAAVAIAVVVLDLAIYLQHVLFHAVPVLWRLHRMHHADLDLDVTSGARFHSLEIVLSMVLKYGLVVALGAPPLGVLIFEVLLNGTAMFNHANAHIPPSIDRVLRLIVVTPDMHRVHHSVLPAEANSNFGFNLPWWDRLFGTYRDQPEGGHSGMTIGLGQFREPAWQRLDRMLIQPFQGAVGFYPLGRGRDRDGA
jgi:sterol desaturase/sphingolipid hydroxylase (fatty acid hydroxylase superfamily)